MSAETPAIEEEGVEETFGIYLTKFEMMVFELAHSGLPGFRIATRLACSNNTVRLTLREGTPVRRALQAANRATHRETQERRDLLMRMSLDEAQDQLSRPDSEVSLADKRELIYQVWDRMGLPKQTSAKVEATSTVFLVPAVAVSAALAEAGQRLLAAAWDAPRPVVIEAKATEEGSE